MKRTFLSIMLLAMTMGAMAQSTDTTIVNNKKEQVASVPEVAPMFRGGQEALKKFLTNNVTYPKAAAAYGVEGSVVMTFFVNEDGSLSDISAKDCKIDRFNTTKFSQETEARQKEIKEEFALLFAKEGARVIRKMPKWSPAKLNGKPVRVKCNQSIKFSIPNK